MQTKDLKSASVLAARYGVKAIIYGPPGSAKTPLSATCPRPVMCVCEPGLLSMRKTPNIPCWEGYTVDRIDEFFKWLGTPEAKNFDTVCIDSISEMAEISLRLEQERNKDGRAAYRHMKDWVCEKLGQLYYMPAKHTYLIAKMGLVEEDGVAIRKPYFPGRELNIQVPHMYDGVFHIGLQYIQGVSQLAIRTRSTHGTFARDRSSNLDELEFPHMGNIFTKAML